MTVTWMPRRLIDVTVEDRILYGRNNSDENLKGSRFKPVQKSMKSK